MKSIKDLRKKAASRERKSAPIYSTSEARANFAEALETAQLDSAVIGFDRYGRTVAALVPVEAIYMLAGLGDDLDRGVRGKIKRAAHLFVHNVPNRIGKGLDPEPAPSAAVKKKSAKGKGKGKGERR
jgi:hypothetical protein